MLSTSLNRWLVFEMMRLSIKPSVIFLSIPLWWGGYYIYSFLPSSEILIEPYHEGIRLEVSIRFCHCFCRCVRWLLCLFLFFSTVNKHKIILHQFNIWSIMFLIHLDIKVRLIHQNIFSFLSNFTKQWTPSLSSFWCFYR